MGMVVVVVMGSGLLLQGPVLFVALSEAPFNSASGGSAGGFLVVDTSLSFARRQRLHGALNRAGGLLSFSVGVRAGGDEDPIDPVCR